MAAPDGDVDQEVQMRELAEYAARYQNARLTRDEQGVLEVALHTEAGPLAWSESAHRKLAISSLTLRPTRRTAW
jgi:hypothetical protein